MNRGLKIILLNEVVNKVAGVSKQRKRDRVKVKESLRDKRLSRTRSSRG